MPVGPTPLYLQVLQWANMIISLLYPVATVVILALALVEFKKLVRNQQKAKFSSASKAGGGRSRAERKKEKSS